jgi:hypothetical protein
MQAGLIMALAKEQRPKKLLGQVQDAIHLKDYPVHTEEAYINWAACAMSS